MDKKLKVVCYCRVSKPEQNLNNQLLALREYSKRNDFEIVGEYLEQGVSGSKTSRPKLDAMLKDMRVGKFNAIIVWKFDRLGRNTKHLLDVLEEMKNKNVRLIATSQNIDTGTSMGKFFFTILAGFSEMERELIRERIMLGLARRKAEGLKTGRPQGSRDKKPRKKMGYLIFHAKQRGEILVAP